jgi:hypothetical protein
MLVPSSHTLRFQTESRRESQTYENEPTETAEQLTFEIPSITIDDPDQNRTVKYESSSSTETETEMSSSHRSSHHSSSSSKGKGHSSKSKSKKDDWSEITDPEERRRVQNRIAQRKFRSSPFSSLQIEVFFNEQQETRPRKQRSVKSERPKTERMLATPTILQIQEKWAQTMNFRACPGARCH